MKINEIFLSISGESFEAGKPAVFIRAHGCNLRCSYCDSLYAVEGLDYTEMTVDEIVTQVSQFECEKIIFTGGEPLDQLDAIELIGRLLTDGYNVEIETNGAVDLAILDRFTNDANMTITMDWKCPSSNMRKKMIESNLRKLRSIDVLKFVVSSAEDLDEMQEVSKVTSAQCFVSPVFGKIEPKEIVEYILENKLFDVRFQLQIHKIIWDSNLRGV